MWQFLLACAVGLIVTSNALAGGVTVALTYNSETEPPAIVQENLAGDSVVSISLDGDPSPGIQAVTTPTLVVVYDGGWH